MCGIAGGWAARPDREALERSLNAMVHRGPDSSGTCLPGPGFLGARRLAILDLPGGEQPARNADRSVAAVLNGEIYNFEDLRPGARGDTAILPSLWEERGVDLFARLRGMFALAILDTRQGALVLARDRMGKKPLYYHVGDDGLRFASDLRGLLPLLPRRPSVSRQAVEEYLALGYVPGSILEGVDVLPPGSWIRYDGRLTRGRFWAPPPFEGRVSAEEVRSSIAEAVRIRLRSDVPVGLFLSGGIDSTIVAIEAAKHAKVRAFTVSFPGELDEAPAAGRTAAALGLPHDILRIPLDPVEGVREVARAFDQPFADPSAIPTLAIAREARKHAKVVLTGDGGDELFAGYRRHVAARLLDSSPGWLSGALGKLPLRARGRSALGFASRFVSGLNVPFPTRYLRWAAGLWERPVAALEEVEGRGELERFLNADLRLFLPGDLLVKMDRATMWNSLEARSPFLDTKVVEAARRLPPSSLLTRFRTKTWLRELYDDALPAEVRRGAKKGFEPPLEAWMSGALKPLWTDVLGANAKVWGYLDRSELSSASPKALYALLLLELWLGDFLSRMVA